MLVSCHPPVDVLFNPEPVRIPAIPIVLDAERIFTAPVDRAAITQHAARVDGEKLIAVMADRYPEAFDALAAVGADPRVKGERENIYLSLLSEALKRDFVNRFQDLETNAKGIKIFYPEDFSNVGLHCLVVGAGVEYLAEKIFSGNKAKIHEAATAAILHDANKPAEAQRRNLARAIATLQRSDKANDRHILAEVSGFLNAQQKGLFAAVQRPYSTDSYERYAGILRSLKITDGVISSIIHGGETTGHGSFFRFVRSARNEGGAGYELQADMGMMVAMLIHAVDDHVSSPLDRSPSLILTPRDRMRCSEFDKRYPFMLTEGIAAVRGNAETSKYFPTDVRELSGRTDAIDAICYMDFQPALADAINQAIALGMRRTGCDPKVFLRDELAGALAKYAPGT